MPGPWYIPCDIFLESERKKGMPIFPSSFYDIVHVELYSYFATLLAFFSPLGAKAWFLDVCYSYATFVFLLLFLKIDVGVCPCMNPGEVKLKGSCELGWISITKEFKFVSFTLIPKLLVFGGLPFFPPRSLVKAEIGFICFSFWWWWRCCWFGQRWWASHSIVKGLCPGVRFLLTHVLPLWWGRVLPTALNPTTSPPHPHHILLPL